MPPVENYGKDENQSYAESTSSSHPPTQNDKWRSYPKVSFKDSVEVIPVSSRSPQVAHIRELPQSCPEYHEFTIKEARGKAQIFAVPKATIHSTRLTSTYRTDPTIRRRSLSLRSKPTPTATNTGSSTAQGHSREVRILSSRLSNLQRGPVAAKAPFGNNGLSEDFVVDSIRDHCYAPNGGLLFRVRWYVYSPKEHTWEPLAQLRRSQVMRYLKRGDLPPQDV